MYLQWDGQVGNGLFVPSLRQSFAVRYIKIFTSGFFKSGLLDGLVDGLKSPRGKLYGFLELMRHISIKLHDFKKSFWGKLLSRYLPHISVKIVLIPQFERQAQVWKKCPLHCINLSVPLFIWYNNYQLCCVREKNIIFFIETYFISIMLKWDRA